MKSTLLIVDDRPENLLALEALLDGNYRLIKALSGREALEQLEEHPIDLILMDIEMPGMDGYETARRITQMEPYQDLPIIFISGVFMDDPYVKKGYEVGGVDYFTKPFNPGILRRKVALYASMREKDRLLKEKEKKIKELERLLKSRDGTHAS